MKIRNIILSLSSIGLLSSLAVASPFDGLYVGAGAGMASKSMDLNVSHFVAFESNGEISSPNVSQGAGSDVNRFSPVETISIGWGHVLENTNVYLGAEAFGSLANRKASDEINLSTVSYAGTDTLTSSSSVQMNNKELGIDLKPGYVVGNTLFYGRLGLALNQATLKSDASHSLNNMFFNDSSSLHIAENHNFVGVRLGFGAEHLMTQHLALTADYVFTYYGKATFNGVTSSSTDFPEEHEYLNNSVRVTSQEATVGVAYYFQ